MHTDAHITFIERVPERILGNPRSFLRKCFYNYRTGKGLRLSIEGIELIKQCPEYKWVEIDLPIYIQSREITKIDNASRSPFYIEFRKLYISDEDVSTYYIMAGDFHSFMDML